MASRSGSGSGSGSGSRKGEDNDDDGTGASGVGAALAGRMALNTNKAGMGKVDAEAVNKIIMSMSEGSRYLEAEKERHARTAVRIADMKARASKIGAVQRAGMARKAAVMLEALEAERELGTTMVLVDMDMFYAAIEERDNPELRGKPMAVGGMSMISTSNYVARQYGVRAAMPGYIGKALCPELILVKSHFDKYKAAAATIRGILAEYDEHVQAVSLDEAYVDITARVKAVMDATGSSHEIAAGGVVAEMRQRIFDATHLTASAGTGPNKLVAKIAADMNKPNGQTYVAPDRDAVLSFMARLPVRKVPGIGKVTAQVLDALGVRTCADVLGERRGELLLLFSAKSSRFFFRAALGLGSGSSTTTDVVRVRKSIGHERTFGAVSARNQLVAKLSSLAGMVVRDMQAKSLKGATVVLKLKTTAFKVISRSTTLRAPTDAFDDVYGAAVAMLHEELPLTLRLMGIRMTGLVDARSASLRDHLVRASAAPLLPPLDCPVCSAQLRISTAAMSAHVEACLEGVTEDAAAKAAAGSAKAGPAATLDTFFAHAPLPHRASRARRRKKPRRQRKQGASAAGQVIVLD
ncbi:POLK protein [Thecamonas trahens ATCC 50062]|uniref:DNA polymerase kappa n=1 Tax=Thecamonas trahens ATCC 50062 TaxID=461836 RepID=A0A0L0DEL6_THETB|nr:POLK protein [Thecamonas trahens ATCC 50062]KNC50660.1 POLK protein [Thecamonas trahens ATCC 50062]|eukprot:XP_013762540.1 POLK protein [Thecamonas trahens ATCC 50062]